MSTKHTPGPWNVVPIGSEKYVEADGPKMICDMQRNEAVDNRGIEEIDANARLIAAAPELLLFCETVSRSACLEQFNGDKCICFACEARRLVAKAEKGEV